MLLVRAVVRLEVRLARHPRLNVEAGSQPRAERFVVLGRLVQGYFRFWDALDCGTEVADFPFVGSLIWLGFCQLVDSIDELFEDLYPRFALHRPGHRSKRNCS